MINEETENVDPTTTEKIALVCTVASLAVLGLTALSERKARRNREKYNDHIASEISKLEDEIAQIENARLS